MKDPRKAVVAVGTAVAVLGMSGIALAASLSSVTTQKAGAAQSVVSSCASGAVNVTYGAPTDAGTGWQSTSVVVVLTTGDATTCSAASAKIYVSLSNGATPILATGSTSTVVNGQTSYTIALGTWASGKSMADVSFVDIAIQ